jgi:hypothetical protein
MTKYDKINGELVTLRNQLYQIRITMYNNMDKPVFIPYKVVMGLVIEETMINWWTKGWIILQNDFEVLEKGANLDLFSDQEKNSSKSQSYIYKFRHDGRNKINIRISTISDGINDEKLWTMDYDFVVYDVEDMESINSIKKSKKFYFIDERYQIFSERNIPWSTSTHGDAAKSGSPVWSLPDSQRKMNPCDAIKSIINTASCNTFTNSINEGEIKVGYDYEFGSIDKPDIPLNSINNDLWNKGNSSPDYNVFYTSPSNSTVIDDLDFMLNHAVGDKKDPIFLKFGRYDKNWELLSLKDYFKQAKQLEQLLLNDGVAPTSTAYVGRAPIQKDDKKIINFTSPRASLINNYKFSQMAPVDDFRFTNRPIHMFDFSTGTYNIHAKDNKLESFYENLKEICSSGELYSFSSTGGKAQVWMNINKTKREGISVENTLLTQGSPLLNSVRMTKDMLFLNQSLYFQNEGLTLRTPGNFIFVDKLDASDKNLFNDKFLGQWFITKVIHYFDQNMYVTDVYSNKFDGIQPHWDVLDKKY